MAQSMIRLQAYLQEFGLNSHSLKQIPELAFFIILSFFSFFALYFIIQWYKNFKKARNIEDTPTAKIRSAAQGYVEIEGKQKYLNKLPTTAPLSQLPCTWYRYTIDHGLKNNWYRLEQGESTQSFILVDDTGESIVDPAGAQVTCALKDSWYGFNKYPKGKPSNIFWRLIGTFGNYRYCEWRMHENHYLYVAGNFSTQNDPHTHESYHFISKQGLNKSSPFLISSVDQKKLIFQYKLTALAFFIGYSILLIIIGWMLVGRFF